MRVYRSLTDGSRSIFLKGLECKMDSDELKAKIQRLKLRGYILEMRWKQLDLEQQFKDSDPMRNGRNICTARNG